VSLKYFFIYGTLNLTVYITLHYKGSLKRCSSWTVLNTQCISTLSSGFPLSQGNAEALGRWGGKTKHHLIFCFLTNTSAKNIIAIGSCMSRL